MASLAKLRAALKARTMSEGINENKQIREEFGLLKKIDPKEEVLGKPTRNLMEKVDSYLEPRITSAIDFVKGVSGVAKRRKEVTKKILTERANTKSYTANEYKRKMWEGVNERYQKRHSEKYSEK